MDLERVSAPLPVPWTAIYSKRDGILAWESCVCSDLNGQCIAIDAPHLAMAPQSRNPENRRHALGVTSSPACGIGKGPIAVAMGQGERPWGGI